MRNFLFLQGPCSPFFSELGDALAARGHGIHRINLCIGDQMFWRRAGSVNYRGKPSAWPRFIGDYLDSHGVTDVVLLGEQRPYHRQAILAAKARGLQVVVTDFGYIRPDWIAFELDGMNGCSRFPRDAKTIREIARHATPPDLANAFCDSFWTMALGDMIYDLSNWLLWFLYPHYVPYFKSLPPLIYLGNGYRMLFSRREQEKARRVLDRLQADKTPYFIFPLQLHEDFQIRSYSDFPNLRVAIETVVKSFAAHAGAEDHLLVKLHPLDSGINNWKRLVRGYAEEEGVPDRVHYLDGGNLESIVQGSRGMVTINSTAALPAMLYHCPVIALGQAVYNLPGLTFQGPLDDFWRNPPPPDGAFLNDFITAMTATILIRGVYYRRPGLDAAIHEAAYRLHHHLVNRVLPQPLRKKGVFNHPK